MTIKEDKASVTRITLHFFRMLLLVVRITLFNGIKGSAAQFAGHFFCILLKHKDILRRARHNMIFTGLHQ
jgi:hypothetical protein